MNVPVGENPNPKLLMVKDFVLKHWNDSSPVYAEITIRSKEGDPTTYKVNIDIDERSEKRLTMNIISERYDRRLINDPKRTGKVIRKVKYYEAHKIEKILIPDRSARKSSNDYFLGLSDTEGKAIFDW